MIYGTKWSSPRFLKHFHSWTTLIKKSSHRIPPLLFVNVFPCGSYSNCICGKTTAAMCLWDFNYLSVKLSACKAGRQSTPGNQHSFLQTSLQVYYFFCLPANQCKYKIILSRQNNFYASFFPIKIWNDPTESWDKLSLDFDV